MRISSPFSNGHERSTALYPAVALSTNARSLDSTPTNEATAAAAVRMRGGMRSWNSPTSASSRTTKRAGWRSISSRIACCACCTRRGTTSTVAWFRYVIAGSSEKWACIACPNAWRLVTGAVVDMDSVSRRGEGVGTVRAARRYRRFDAPARISGAGRTSFAPRPIALVGRERWSLDAAAARAPASAPHARAPRSRDRAPHARRRDPRPAHRSRGRVAQATAHDAAQFAPGAAPWPHVRDASAHGQVPATRPRRRRDAALPPRHERAVALLAAGPQAGRRTRARAPEALVRGRRHALVPGCAALRDAARRADGAPGA